MKKTQAHDRLVEEFVPLIRKLDRSSGFNAAAVTMEITDKLDLLEEQEQEFCFGLMFGFSEGRKASAEYDGQLG